MLTAAVASTDATSSGYLRACLQQTGLVQSVREWTISGEKRLSSPEAVPDVVLLDVSRDTEPYFALAAHLRRLRPTVRLIACSAVQQPEPELLLQAMRSGVQEFFAKPIDPTALRDILARFLQEKGTAESKVLEKPIVVIGAKGGVGATTVTVNLAVQLAQISKKRVVLLDFARPVGHVPLLLDLQPRFSVRDAVENLDRLDGHFFSGLLARHASSLEVLAGTSHPEEWQQITVPALTRVMNVAQSTFDLVLIDGGSHYSSESNPLLRLARMILLVAEANVPALWALERHLSATIASGIDPERIRIVINRWRRGDEDALKSLEKNIKRPIFARLPNDFRQVSEATNLGVPLSANHNNQLVSTFRQLAALLVGLTPPATGKRSAFANLFPFSR